MASQNIARLGVVLGLDTAEFQASVDKAISENTKLKNAIRRDSEAAAKEIIRLKFATDDYGKTLTMVEKLQREMNTGGQFSKATKEIQQELLNRAKAYDMVAKAQKNVNFQMTEQQKLQLTYQTTDLFTQIASGQSPFIAILQQGGQLKDSMGGLGNMFKALGTIITPLNVSMLAFAGSIAAAAVAAYKGIMELDKLKDTMTLTGNFAGMTTSSFYAMSDALDKRLNITMGDAKEIMMQLAGSGKFVSKTMESVAEVIGRIAFISGKDVAEATKDLMGLFDGTAASAKRLNDQYHFLNLAQYKRIEQLEKEGRLQESAKLQADLLSESLENTTRQLGNIESAWIKIKEVASQAWNNMMGWGREDTIAEKIQKLQAEIDRQVRMMSEKKGYGITNLQADQTQLDAMRENMRLLQKQLQMEKDLADQKSKQALANKKAIDDYAAAGGIGKARQIESETFKMQYKEQIELAKITADEIGDIEIEAAEKVYDVILKYQNKSDAERRAFGKQLEEQQALEVAAILAERDKKIAVEREKIRKKQWEEDLARFEQETTVAFNLLELHNKAVTQTERDIANRKEELQLAHDKLMLQSEMMFLSDKERALMNRKLETEKQIATWKNSEHYKNLNDQEKLKYEKELRDVESLKDASIELADSLKNIQDLTDSVWKNMENAIESFVQTGKFSIKDFTRSVIQDMLAMNMKLQAMTLVRALLGSFMTSMTYGTNIGSQQTMMLAAQDAPFRANGGPVSGGSSYIVGENGPELFMPSGSGTIIPNNKMSQSAAVTNVTNNYINAIDAKSFEQRLLESSNTVWAANQYANKSLASNGRRA